MRMDAHGHKGEEGAPGVVLSAGLGLVGLAATGGRGFAATDGFVLDGAGEASMTSTGACLGGCEQHIKDRCAWDARPRNRMNVGTHSDRSGLGVPVVIVTLVRLIVTARRAHARWWLESCPRSALGGSCQVTANQNHKSKHGCNKTNGCAREFPP